MATDTKTEARKAVESAEFYARGRNLLLVRIPEILTVAAGTGLQQIIQRSVLYEFEKGDGRLTIKSNQDLLPTGLPDDDDPEGKPTVESALEWFRRHPNKNVLFFEEGDEPDAQHPSEEQQIDRLLDAVGDLNPDGVEAVLEQERATHSRDRVLYACERALEKIAEARQGEVSVASGDPDG